MTSIKITTTVEITVTPLTTPTPLAPVPIPVTREERKHVELVQDPSQIDPKLFPDLKMLEKPKITPARPGSIINLIPAYHQCKSLTITAVGNELLIFGDDDNKPMTIPIDCPNHRILRYKRINATAIKLIEDTSIFPPPFSLNLFTMIREE